MRTLAVVMYVEYTENVAHHVVLADDAALDGHEPVGDARKTVLLRYD